MPVTSVVQISLAPPLFMPITEKYEFDMPAVKNLLKEFIKRKYSANADRVETSVGYDGQINKMTVICGERDGDEAMNGTTLRSMTSGERKIDVGQL